MSNLQFKFIEFCINSDVLRFGEFKTKAGRLSPYFFNAGLFYTGSSLWHLADFYAHTLIKAMEDGCIECDMLFGPAYKGITLAAAVAVRMSELGHDIPFSYNRKEAKDHGEGGNVVGAPLSGNVVIIDDVISAGTSVNESVKIIRGAGAKVSGVLLALDRMECAGNAVEISQKSAVQEVMDKYGIPVVAIANLEDLMAYLKESDVADFAKYGSAISAYRARYGSGH